MFRKSAWGGISPLAIAAFCEYLLPSYTHRNDIKYINGLPLTKKAHVVVRIYLFISDEVGVEVANFHNIGRIFGHRSFAQVERYGLCVFRLQFFVTIGGLLGSVWLNYRF